MVISADGYREAKSGLIEEREALVARIVDVDADIEALERVWRRYGLGSGQEDEPFDLAARLLPSLDPDARSQALDTGREAHKPEYGSLTMAIREAIDKSEGDFTTADIRRIMGDAHPDVLAATSSASVAATVKRLHDNNEIHRVSITPGGPTTYRKGPTTASPD